MQSFKKQPYQLQLIIFYVRLYKETESIFI